jgi:hypothetical protein
MIYVLVGIATFIGGVLLSGYIYALIGGLKTDVALLKTKAMTDAAALEARLHQIESTIAAKLP